MSRAPWARRGAARGSLASMRVSCSRRVNRFIAWSLVAALSLAACTGAGSSTPSPQASPPAASSVPAEVDPVAADVPGYDKPLRLVTLGDGYTDGSGTSSPGRDSWPSQLVDAMRRGGLDVVWLNLAEQSHTSDIVVEEQLGQVASLAPDVVTLQVGVNDIISGDTSFYRQNIELILDELLDILPADRIFAITTPDHTLTDYGLSFGSSREGHAAVEALNGPWPRSRRRAVWRSSTSPRSTTWWPTIPVWSSATDRTARPSSTLAGWRSSAHGSVRSCQPSSRSTACALLRTRPREAGPAVL